MHNNQCVTKNKTLHTSVVWIWFSQSVTDLARTQSQHNRIVNQSLYWEQASRFSWSKAKGWSGYRAGSERRSEANGVGTRLGGRSGGGSMSRESQSREGQIRNQELRPEKVLHVEMTTNTQAECGCDPGVLVLDWLASEGRCGRSVGDVVRLGGDVMENHWREREETGHSWHSLSFQLQRLLLQLSQSVTLWFSVDQHQHFKCVGFTPSRFCCLASLQRS